MMKTVPEPDAKLLEAKDVHKDVVSLTEALERRRAERKSYEILNLSSVRNMLNQLIESGVCTNEEEAIERGLKTLLTAIKLQPGIYKK